MDWMNYLPLQGQMQPQQPQSQFLTPQGVDSMDMQQMQQAAMLNALLGTGMESSSLLQKGAKSAGSGIGGMLKGMMGGGGGAGGAGDISI